MLRLRKHALGGVRDEGRGCSLPGKGSSLKGRTTTRWEVDEPAHGKPPTRAEPSLWDQQRCLPGLVPSPYVDALPSLSTRLAPLPAWRPTPGE